VTFPSLIPGASYRIVDLVQTAGGIEPAVRREFVVGAGEALDLGDLTITWRRRRPGQ
jgi:hypothetical protein